MIASSYFLHANRYALTDADAKRRQRALAAALFQSMDGRQGQPGARHAQRMAERDGAAMRVDVLGIVGKPELAQAYQRLRREGFVDLDQVEVADLELQPLHQFPGRRDWADAHDARRHAR